MKLYIIHMNQPLKKELQSLLLDIVSVEKRKRIQAFHHWQDAQRSLTGDVFVRKLIQDRYQIPSRDIQFYQNPYGKPFVKGIEDFYFNLSHSGEYIICGVGNRDLGVDIQRVEALHAGMEEYVFSSRELARYEQLSASEKVAFFYEIWALKESYIKAVGKGLSIPLSSIEMITEDHPIKVLCPYINKTYFFQQYDIKEDYKTAVCWEKEEFEESPIYVDLNAWGEAFKEG